MYGETVKNGKERDKLIKVSVIIRTCNRPDVLKLALNSIKHQTYKNIEIVVVEDGENTSEDMIKDEYSDMNIKYKATMLKLGRSAVGNVGLSMATGEYFNFLDDDDIFYPNHIETLVEAIEESKAKAAYSIADESQIRILSQKPYKIKEKRVIQRYKQPYNKLLLFSFNYIPIQSILFSRELYDQLGGFDEKLQFLEDWDVWVRYSTITDFLFVPCVTSKYYVPFRSKKRMQRNRELEYALETLRGKFAQYSVNMNVRRINQDMDYVLNVYNKKSFYYYLKMIRNFILYKEL